MHNQPRNTNAAACWAAVVCVALLPGQMARAAPRGAAYPGNAADHRAVGVAGAGAVVRARDDNRAVPPRVAPHAMAPRLHAQHAAVGQALAILPAADLQVLQPERFHRPWHVPAGSPLGAWLMWAVMLLMLTGVALAAAIVALRRRGQHLARATRTLRVCMAFDAAMFEGLPDPVYLCDGSARLIGCNTAYEQFFGTRRDQLLGKMLNHPDGHPHAIPADVASAIRQADQQLLASRQPIRCRHRWRTGDREIHVRHWARPLLAADGGVAGLMGGFVDISPAAEGAHDAGQSQPPNAARDADPVARPTLLAMMSHEIRTPLQAVIGIVDMLLRQHGIRGKARRHLATAHGAARSLLALVDDLLHMSNTGVGSMALRPEPAHVASLLRESVRMYGPMAMRKGLTLKVHTVRTPPLRGRHLVDPGRLRQILTNLIGNAIKFSEQGEIAMALEHCGESPRGDRLRLTVRDQGVGIDRAELPRLFEPFFRARTACEIPGTGLGLPMSRQLARQMGGDLDVDSEPGVGTVATLTLTVPRAGGTGYDRIVSGGLAARYRRSIRAGRRRGLPAGGYRVLVVDDHDVCRLLLARQLGHLGHRVVCADNGAQALAMAESQRARIDVVVIDCNMPAMNGFDVVRQWRARERANQWPRKPVIGYSADPTAENRARAMDAGMDACVVKPMDVKTLGALLVSLVCASSRAAQSGAASMSGGGGGGGGDRLLDLLESTNASDLCAMHSALASGDWPAFGAALHRVKGAARMAGRSSVSQCCDRLDTALQARDSAAMTAGVAQLSHALRAWADDLRRWAAQRG